MVQITSELTKRLASLGVECFLHNGAGLPENISLEPPCSIKWMNTQYKLLMGAFSYAVSGFFFDVEIGRYTSIGESVQLGRGDHPTKWLSTSPAFYLANLFMVGTEFDGSNAYHKYVPNLPKNTSVPGGKSITIGHDVYIGHGALVRPGIKIGHGAIVAAHAVVVKDVPPYGIVAGNPAVLKKYRVRADLIEPLLAVEWWRFAPWQLSGIDVTNPDRALSLLEKVCPKLQPYEPKKIYHNDLT